MLSFFGSLVDLASSPLFIILYIAVVLVLMVLVVLALMKREGNYPARRHNAPRREPQEQPYAPPAQPQPAAPEAEEEPMPSEEGMGRFGRLADVDANSAQYARRGWAGSAGWRTWTRTARSMRAATTNTT